MLGFGALGALLPLLLLLLLLLLATGVGVLLLLTPLPLLAPLYATVGAWRAAGTGVDGATVTGCPPPKMVVGLRMGANGEGAGAGAVPFVGEPSEDERRAKLLVVFTAVNCWGGSGSPPCAGEVGPGSVPSLDIA